MLKEYFEKYTSNCVAGTSHQGIRGCEEEKIRTSQIYYKITAGGKFDYSLLFSSITDGTGKMGYKPNTICDTFKILSARVGKLAAFPEGNIEKLLPEIELFPSAFVPLTFGGKPDYSPCGSEFFTSDPISLEFNAGEYLCLELTTKATYFPCHPELQIPSYVKEEGGEWHYSSITPLSIMIGCSRFPKKGKIAFIGDSITQGVGPQKNSYKNWCARLSSLIGNDYSYYNLGIGWGCAYDVANGGVWIDRAKHADIVFICFGVNDIDSDCTAEEIIENLNKIINALCQSGCRIFIQTIPPFNQFGERRNVFHMVNDAIRGDLGKKTALVFDCVPVLSMGEDAEYKAHFGPHPNEEGCRIWAENLYESVKNYL